MILGRPLSTFAVGAVLLTLDASVSALTAPIVDLTYASYQGLLFTTTNVTGFYGMRYAAPPTGTLRFQAPQAPATTSGVTAADAYPSECYQANYGASATNPYSSLTGVGSGSVAKREVVKRQSGASEDCLSLTVVVPGSSGTLPAANTYPVVIWIHGGGYIAGNEGSYDVTELVLDSLGEAVVVNIQYRLGIFGFLPGSEVKTNGALNAGLLDQNFAFQWVQEHISKFGGDPTRVTIWGQSAGAGSVLQHIIADGGETSPPLFRAAMTSSTFLPSQYWYNATVPEYIYSTTVNMADCQLAPSTFTCLQELDVDTLMTINVNLNADGLVGTYTTVPVIDGTFITDSPTAILKSGHANGEVLLSVTNPLDGGNFVSPSEGAAATNTTLYISQLFPFLTDAQVDQAAALYEPTDPTSFYLQSVNVMGEAIFICPTYLLLQSFAALGRSQWKGEFAIPPGTHGQDVEYYFTNPTTPPTYPNLDFQKAFSGSFLSTAISLNPNDKVNASTITPAWPTWNATTPGTEMLFNTTDGTVASALPVVHTIETDVTLLERCAFWQSVADIVGQ